MHPPPRVHHRPLAERGDFHLVLLAAIVSSVLVHDPVTTPRKQEAAGRVSPRRKIRPSLMRRDLFGLEAPSDSIPHPSYEICYRSMRSVRFVTHGKGCHTTSPSTIMSDKP